MQAALDAAANTVPTSLNGCWILDRTKGSPSMRGYLETMGVDELAIQAHEKGDQENATYHTITLDDVSVHIVKRSRVNNDTVVDLQLGQEVTVHLPPGDRPKKSLATSNHGGHLEIRSSLQTMNGLASVVDIKTLQKEGEQVYLVQNLTITNEGNGTTHATTRWFLPYTQTPPHLAALPGTA